MIVTLKTFEIQVMVIDNNFYLLAKKKCTFVQ